ncbi:MAG: hypothetical protein WHT63_06035, partial [Tepidiforma sp.]
MREMLAGEIPAITSRSYARGPQSSSTDSPPPVSRIDDPARCGVSVPAPLPRNWMRTPQAYRPAIVTTIPPAEYRSPRNP